MNVGISIIDKLLAGQVHGINDLEKFRIDFIRSGESISSLIKSAQEISNSHLSSELKIENLAYAYWICGQYKLIVETLPISKGSSLAKLVLAHSHLCRCDYQSAAKLSETNLNLADSFQIAALVDALIGLDEFEKAGNILKKNQISNQNDKYLIN